MTSITVIIINYNGERHLPACLDSVLAMDYEDFRVVVVDNASSDRSLELLKEHYPSVGVIRNAENIGFAPAVNEAVRSSDTECVALLNNDMTVERGWLRELVGGYDPQNNYTCVAGLILDWQGERIDFIQGIVNWYGCADQVAFGGLVRDTTFSPDPDLLFACGGSMLVGREVFLRLGGFDESYFAYFEDVDFGWRMRLFGHKVQFRPSAKSFHRHHGTSAAFPMYQRTLLYERNALLCLLKNLDDDHLGKVLGPALLLMCERSIRDTKSTRSDFDLGQPVVDAASQSAEGALARLHAVSDVLSNLDEVFAKRRLIQRGRVVGDAEIFKLFGRPFEPLGRNDEHYCETMSKVTDLFDLQSMIGSTAASSFLVLSDATGGEAAVHRRALDLAAPLAVLGDVSICVAPELQELTCAALPPGITVQPYGSKAQLVEWCQEHDMVVLGHQMLDTCSFLEHEPALVVADCSDAGPESPAAWSHSFMHIPDIYLCADTPQKARIQLEVAKERAGLLREPGLADPEAYNSAFVTLPCRASREATLQAFRGIAAETWKPKLLRSRRPGWGALPSDFRTLLVRRRETSRIEADERIRERDAEMEMAMHLREAEHSAELDALRAHLTTLTAELNIMRSSKGWRLLEVARKAKRTRVKP